MCYEPGFAGTIVTSVGTMYTFLTSKYQQVKRSVKKVTISNVIVNIIILSLDILTDH